MFRIKILAALFTWSLTTMISTSSFAHCTAMHPTHCVEGLTRQIGGAYQKIEQGVNQSIRDAFGADVANVVSFARLPETIETSMNISIINRSSDIASGDARFEDILNHVLGAPLEAMLLQAKSQLGGRGKPIPSDVKELLAVGFSLEILERARVVDSSVEGNLPAAINTLSTSIGDAVGGNHAVVIENTIVFDHIPTAESIVFWAHELTHVEQYGRLGLSGFADAYTTNHRQVEEEADAKSWQFITELGELIDLQRFSLFLIAYRGGQPRYCDHLTIGDVEKHAVYQCGFVPDGREERKRLYDTSVKWQWPRPCDHVTLEDAAHYGICGR